MIHKTRGIVLKTIRYGESSLVITMLTELFGLQAYMVNGIRSTGRQGSKAGMYQPGAILQMIVYHNPSKNLQRIKEATWAFLPKHIFADIIKNCVALYMMETVYNMVKQPEPNTDFFHFCEDALTQLDEAKPAVVANYPIYFSLQAPYFFGFKINDLSPALYHKPTLYLDLAEGVFSELAPLHNHYLQNEDAHLLAELLLVMQPSELDIVSMNRNKRMILLQKLQDYFRLHIQDYPGSKTLEVMQDIFRD